MIQGLKTNQQGLGNTPTKHTPYEWLAVLTSEKENAEINRK
jgi:hypothetical protein